MSAPGADGAPAGAIAPPPRGRGWAIAGFTLLGIILGLALGAVAGFGAGLLWIELTPPQNRAREMGIALLLVFAPGGALLGAILGAILLGRFGARRGRAKQAARAA